MQRIANAPADLKGVNSLFFAPFWAVMDSGTLMSVSIFFPPF
jgi:hypothetical protein